MSVPATVAAGAALIVALVAVAVVVFWHYVVGAIVLVAAWKVLSR